MLVAVAPHKALPGIDPTKNRLDAPALYVPTHVHRVLTDTYPSDAHFVCYLVRDQNGAVLETQPRINKPGLATMRERGFSVSVEVIAADVDNPGHAAWQSHEHAQKRVDEVALLCPTAGVYASRHGLRIVQPISRRLDPEAAEVAAAAWLGELLRRGITADTSCLDWTRHFRVAHFRDERGAYRSPAVAATGMTAVPPPAGPPVARRARSARSTAAVSVAFARELPAELEAAAQPIADAVRPIQTEALGADGGWHDLALRLGAFLLGRGVRPEHLPALVGRVFALAGDTRVDDRVRGAEDTARKWLASAELMSSLDAYPGLARAVRKALGVDVAADTREPVELAPDPKARASAYGMRSAALETASRSSGPSAGSARPPLCVRSPLSGRRFLCQRAGSERRLARRPRSASPPTSSPSR